MTTSNLKFKADVDSVLEQVRDTLLEKNKKYGDSIFNPIRVFSKQSPIDRIKSRLDDKISRIAQGEDDTEDCVLDLMGYLVMFRIASKMEKESEGMKEEQRRIGEKESNR